MESSFPHLAPTPQSVRNEIRTTELFDSPSKTSCTVSLGLGQRIIQLHPSLQCNLRCKHCYSDSSPTSHSGLNARQLCDVIEDAAQLGYTGIAVSGGEPLLYPDLRQILLHAKAQGLITTLTTNGTLFDQRRIISLRGCIDAIAISLDGPPELHNEIRQSSSAFSRMQAGLEVIKSEGIPFGFIHTFTNKSWTHLLWIAEFAAEHGASLLQLHPLESAGRATNLMQGEPPDAKVMAKVYLLNLALADQYRGIMAVHLDAFRRDDLIQNPSYAYIPDFDVHQCAANMADFLGLLVVTAEGNVLPISHDIDESFALCNLHESRLLTAWPNYKAKGYPNFLELCSSVFEEVRTPSQFPFFNWHEMLALHSKIRLKTT